MYKQSEAFDLLDKEEVEGVLSGAFYRPAPASEEPAAPLERSRRLGHDGAAGGPIPRRAEHARAKALPKPEHYKVICISMYTDDLDKLDEMVKALKKRGLTKANRSALIRQALLQIDLDKVPRGL